MRRPFLGRAPSYPIEIHEVTETVPFTDEKVRAWRAEDRWGLYHRDGQASTPQRKRRRASVTSAMFARREAPIVRECSSDDVARPSDP